METLSVYKQTFLKILITCFHREKSFFTQKVTRKLFSLCMASAKTVCNYILVHLIQMIFMHDSVSPATWQMKTVSNSLIFTFCGGAWPSPDEIKVGRLPHLS